MSQETILSETHLILLDNLIYLNYLTQKGNGVYVEDIVKDLLVMSDENFKAEVTDPPVLLLQ